MSTTPVADYVEELWNKGEPLPTGTYTVERTLSINGKESHIGGGEIEVP